MRIFFVILNLFIASAALAQPVCKSLFWEITGNKLKAPSYLYGTMHVSDKLAFKLQDSFFEALKSVDVVGIESTPEDWLKSDYHPVENPVRIDKGMPFETRGFYERSFGTLLPENDALKFLIKTNPPVVNRIFHRTESGLENFSEYLFLDVFIYQAGRKYGKNVVPLENLPHTEELLSYANEYLRNIEDRTRLTSLLRERMLGGLNYGEFIEDTYRKGNLDLLDSANQLFRPSQEYQRYMLDIRNEIMVRSMDSIMQTKTLFAGVGASHLPGSQGMINMLIKKGYKVRPIYTNMEMESPFKAQLEGIKVPVTLQDFTDSDGLFKVRVPGSMYQVYNYKGMKFYLHPDLGNGCFYMVGMVETFGGFFGLSPEKFQAKVDSFLFENVPGKILKKEKSVLPDGNRLIHIENKTVNGDHQIYHLIFTPHLFYMVRVQGFKDYVNGPEAQEFVRSFQVLNKPGGLKKTDFPKQGFSVLLPQQTLTYKDLEREGVSNCQIYSSGMDDDKNQYLLIRSVYHDLQTLEEDSFELAYMCDQFAEKNQLHLKSRTDGLHNGFPCRDFKGTFLNQPVVGKLVLAHPFYYLLMTSNSRDPKAFLESLTFSKPRLEEPFSTYFDSTLQFKVEMPRLVSVKPSETKPFRPKVQSQNKKKDKEEPEAEPIVTSYIHSFTHNETHEVIKVRMAQYNDYRNMGNIDTLRQWTRDEMRYRKKYKILKEHFSQPNGVYVSDFLIGDTNTRATIRRKEFVKGKILYELTTDSDSGQISSEFVQRFFDSFQPFPKDTTGTLFSSKLSVLFADALGKDETRKRNARFTLSDSRLRIWESDVPTCVAAMKKADFQRLDAKTKIEILKQLGSFRSDTLVPHLVSFYKSFSDSSDLQAAVLIALAKTQTPKSTDAFLQLVIQDPPPMDEDEVEAMLNPYFKKLDLANRLFPGLMDLTRYPEFKTEVYKLLGWVAYNKKVKPEDFKNHQLHLAKDLKDAILRQYHTDKPRRQTSKGVFNREGAEDYLSKTDTKTQPIEAQLFEEGDSDFKEQELNVYLYALIVSGQQILEPSAFKPLSDKALRIKPSLTSIFISTYLLAQNYPVPDSILKVYSKDPVAMLLFYQRLNKFGMEDRFPVKPKNKFDMLKGFLIVQNNMSPGEDSLVFVKELTMAIRGKSRGIVFFKSWNDEEEVFQLCLSGPHPKDGSPLNFNTLADCPTEDFDTPKEMEQAMKKQLSFVRLQNRDRLGRRYSYR